MSLSEIMAWVLLAASCVGLAYLGLAVVMVLRLARRRVEPASEYPAVTILKPLHGAEPRLFDNLASACALDYPAPVQIVCGVQSVADPAIEVVRALQAAFPDRAIDLVIESRPHGSNRKVSNLINMDAVSRHGIIVLADSDMVVAPDYLRRLVDDLSAPGIGAVTCLYHGVTTGTVWSRLSALAIDAHFLPSVAVGVELGFAKPCFGSTIALRRETLERIGGFARLADELADDYLLGEAVRGTGAEVAVTPFAVGHVCSESRLGEVMRQEVRWARTIRQIDPAGHAGSIVTHPFALAVVAWSLAPSWPVPVMAAVAALALRSGLCLAVERAFGLRTHPYWLIMARDLLSFAVFVASFFGRGVSWRGHRYDVTPRGVMTPRDEALNPR